MMENFVYYNPTQLIFGRGQLAQLEDKAKQLGSTVLLVYGGGSIKRSGLYDKVVSLLQAAGNRVLELPGVEPNPRLGTVQKGIDLCRAEGVDWILAVGGGSVIDAAKAVAVGVPYEGNVWDFYTRKAVAEKALPLGTVLTLAATVARK